MMINDLIIIGGGPAGFMSAIAAKQQNPFLSVLLLEKMPLPCRKLLLTGKGRCNLTNTFPWTEFSQKVRSNAVFFRPSFYEFSNEKLMSFFQENGLPLVVERGSRVYPESMRSIDVFLTLKDIAERLGVVIHTSTPVDRIEKTDEGFLVFSSNENMSARTLVIATGGLSYPTTGSTGDGYTFAAAFGHKMVPTFPSLTALIPETDVSALEGLSLKNVGLRLFESGVLLQEETGDLDFTNDGIEGPIEFKISRRAVKSLVNGGRISVEIDLKPALSETELRNRMAKELAEGKYTRKSSMSSVLGGFIPKKLIGFFIEHSEGLNLDRLPYALKHLSFRISSYVGYRRAVVTAGGVNVADINKKTLQSKLCSGLFFAGEILDIDADTGGYNLQIAFSTGFLAGKSAAKSLTL